MRGTYQYFFSTMPKVKTPNSPLAVSSLSTSMETSDFEVKDEDLYVFLS